MEKKGMSIMIGLLGKPPMKSENDNKEVGLLEEPMVDTEKYPLDKQANDAMTKALMENRHLGAKDPGNPGNFWIKIAEFWGLPEEEAQSRRCGNCEYFDNSLEAKNAMKIVPVTPFDKLGGERGYCHKYTFICHDLRVCDQWEEKQYEDEE